MSCGDPAIGDECGGREAASAVVQADGGLEQGGMGWEMVDAGYFL